MKVVNLRVLFFYVFASIVGILGLENIHIYEKAIAGYGCIIDKSKVVVLVK
jgi:hypothetical protein